MNPRERIKSALNHKQPDKLPIDFGSGLTTGIHVSTIYKLRQYFGLDKPGTPVKLLEPFMGLGEIKEDLRKILESDVVGLDGSSAIFFGFKNENWKEWEYDDGTPVLVPGLFNTEKNEDGSLYQYPLGDKTARPSMIMPKNGFYFDAIIRQEEIDYGNLDPEDNTEEFGVVSDDEVEYLKKKAEKLFGKTDYAIFGNTFFSSFGDIAGIPGTTLKNPKGIRDVAEWYMLTHTNKDYVKEVFSNQCDKALVSFKKIYDALKDKIECVFIMGTDMGIQNGQFCSVDTYRELYKPFIKRINEWIHENTPWKTFVHSCGAVKPLIPEFIDAGFDIFNPIQVSALDMEPSKLKKEFGKDIVFWGGAVDCQEILPFGTPKQVSEEVRKNIDIFFKDGGYIFANVHNLQANVPIENIAAMLNVAKEYRK
jgi:hypothetical protein